MNNRMKFLLMMIGSVMLAINPMITKANISVTADSTSVVPTPALVCPTTAEVKALTGVDVQKIETEACAFVWRSNSVATVNAICPSDGWACTFDVAEDIVVVHLGVNQRATIHAGTWRYIPAYPQEDEAHNICSLYKKEKTFGASESPPFDVRFQAAMDSSGNPVGPQSCP